MLTAAVELVVEAGAFADAPVTPLVAAGTGEAEAVADETTKRATEHSKAHNQLTWLLLGRRLSFLQLGQLSVKRTLQTKTACQPCW